MSGSKPRRQKTRYKVTQYILFKKGQKKMVDSIEEIEMKIPNQIQKIKKENE